MTTKIKGQRDKIKAEEAVETAKEKLQKVEEPMFVALFSFRLALFPEDASSIVVFQHRYGNESCPVLGNGSSAAQLKKNTSFYSVLSFTVTPFGG